MISDVVTLREVTWCLWWRLTVRCAPGVKVPRVLGRHGTFVGLTAVVGPPFLHKCVSVGCEKGTVMVLKALLWSLPLVELLLAHGAALNAREAATGRPPLALATTSDVAEALVTAGCDTSLAFGRERDTCLHVLARLNVSAAAMRLALENPAAKEKVNQIGSVRAALSCGPAQQERGGCSFTSLRPDCSVAQDGITALHLAAGNLSPANVALLLAAGADPNVFRRMIKEGESQPRGWSALHSVAAAEATALLEGDSINSQAPQETIRLLLDAGAQVVVYNEHEVCGTDHTSSGSCPACRDERLNSCWLTIHLSLRDDDATGAVPSVLGRAQRSP